MTVLSLQRRMALQRRVARLRRVARTKRHVYCDPFFADPAIVEDDSRRMTRPAAAAREQTESPKPLRHSTSDVINL
jgi:hypothetical protein